MGAVVTAPYKKLGAWVTRSNDTVYQAETDGEVEAISIFNTTQNILTDAATPPTVLRSMCSALGAGDQGPSHARVRKGHYWKSTGADAIWWIPLEP